MGASEVDDHWRSENRSVTGETKARMKRVSGAGWVVRLNSAKPPNPHTVSIILIASLRLCLRLNLAAIPLRHYAFDCYLYADIGSRWVILCVR